MGYKFQCLDLENNNNTVTTTTDPNGNSDCRSSIRHEISTGEEEPTVAVAATTGKPQVCKSVSPIITMDNKQCQDQLEHVESAVEEKNKNDGGSPESREPIYVYSSTTFPDGGFDAYMVMFGCFLMSFSTFGQSNSFGVFQNYLKNNQLASSSVSAISWLGSIQVFLSYALGIIAGRVVDSHGPRYLILTASIATILSSFLTAICKTYVQFFFAQSMLVGIANGLTIVTGISCLGHWWHRHRAVALGVLAAGSSMGGTIWPIVYSRLFYNPKIGFTWACRIAGFIQIPLVIVGNIYIKTRLPPREPGPFLDFSAWHNPVFVLFCFSQCVGLMGNWVPLFYMEAIAVQRGVEPGAAFYLITIINAMSL